MKKMTDKSGRIFLAFLTIMMVSLISLQIILLRSQSALVETSSTLVESASPTATATSKPLETNTPLVVKEPDPDPDNNEATPIEKMTFTPSNADLRLGYIDRGLNCSLMSEITALVLEKQFGLQIEIIEYESLDELFALLGSTSRERIDLTLCFLDPTDRSYISKYFGFTKQLGGAYWQDDSNKLLIMANASIVAPLQKDQFCIYSFFRQIRFEPDDFKDTTNAEEWIQNNRAKVRQWTTCDGN